jgi:hypothetical protein
MPCWKGRESSPANRSRRIKLKSRVCQSPLPKDNFVIPIGFGERNLLSHSRPLPDTVDVLVDTQYFKISCEIPSSPSYPET